MVADGHDREAVLASVHGGRSCPPDLLKVLMENQDKWEADDVLFSLVDVDGREDVWQLWLLIFEECGIDTEAQKMQLQRFRLWVFTAADEGGGPDASDAKDVSKPKDGMDGKDTGSGKDSSGGKSKAKSKDDEEERLSKAMLDELADQGMTSIAQLKYLSACMYLGTHASAHECTGLVVGAHVGASETIRKTCKVQGVTTMHSAIDESKKLGSRSPLDTFFTYMTDSMTTVIDDHANYAAVGSSRVRSFYNLLCDTAPNDMAVILYVEDIISRSYRGKGCPTRVDMQKLAVISKKAGESSRVDSDDRSKSKLGESELVAIGSQLQEVTVALSKFEGVESRMTSKLNTAIARLESRVDSVANKVTRLEATDPDKDKHMKCDKCGKKGHRSSACPDK